MAVRNEMLRIETLSDFKRALTCGSRWRAYHNKSGFDFGIREVAKVTPTFCAFYTDEAKEKVSKLYFPLAKDFVSHGNGTVTILCNGSPLLTYTHVNGVD